MNNVKFLQKLFFSIGLSLCYSQLSFSDTIYQWTDPWGQIKYSKTQVQGSMVSDLTELPESQESTEQQKQDAMVRKMQKIQEANEAYQQKKSAEQLLQQQKISKQRHCQALRNRLKDVQANNSGLYVQGNYYRRHNLYPERKYYPGRYGYNFLVNDLYQEIKEYCR
jgi:hypothetical protein